MGGGHGRGVKGVETLGVPSYSVTKGRSHVATFLLSGPKRELGRARGPRATAGAVAFSGAGLGTPWKLHF
jgi:hypothetical protein